MSVKDKLKKLNKAHGAAFADTCTLLNDVNAVSVSTDIPALNIMMGGEPTGTFGSGSVMLVGDTRTFKSGFLLQFSKSFQEKYEDGIIIFLNNEFGIGTEFMQSSGVDASRVVHVTFENAEELRHKTAAYLSEFERGDKVMFIIDSISQSASKKESTDAINGDEKADMTRAKTLNSFWRIITPMLKTKDIPLFAINSSYDDMTSMYAEKIIKGGKQGMLSCNDILMISRRKIKDGTELSGHEFVLKAHKSRTVVEGSKVPIGIRYDNGINKYSGLMEIAINSGLVDNSKKGFYVRKNVEDDKSWRMKNTNCDEFWKPILDDPEFTTFCKKAYRLHGGALMEEEDKLRKMMDDIDDMELDVDPETGEVLN